MSRHPELNGTGAYIPLCQEHTTAATVARFYDIRSSALTEDVFATINSRALGSSANFDMIIHDSKIYIAVVIPLRSRSATFPESRSRQ